MASEQRPQIGADWNSLLGSTIEIKRGEKWKIARVMDINVRHVMVLIDGETENTLFTKVSLRGQWRKLVRQIVGMESVFFFLVKDEVPQKHKNKTVKSGKSQNFSLSYMTQK